MDESVKKKSSARKFIIIGAAVVVLIVATIFIFQPDPDPVDPFDDPLDDPFVIKEHNPGPHGPSNPNYSSGKTDKNKNANWQASAMVSNPAY